MKDLIKSLIESMMANVKGASAATLTFDQDNINIIKELWTHFAIIGIGATLIYFLLEMNRKFALEGGDLTMKSFFAPFLKLVIAVAVLLQGGKILGVILTLNNQMITAAQEWVKGDENALQQVIDATTNEIDNYGLVKLLGIIIPMLLCFVVSMVLKLVWWYKGIMYKLEVLFRVGIAPISFADVYSGQNSNAIKYLKEFLVLGIYGVALVVLPNLSMKLSASAFWSSIDEIEFNGIWDMITRICEMAFLAPFAALSCASVARTAAKEALGVIS